VPGGYWIFLTFKGVQSYITQLIGSSADKNLYWREEASLLLKRQSYIIPRRIYLFTVFFSDLSFISHCNVLLLKTKILYNFSNCNKRTLLIRFIFQMINRQIMPVLYAQLAKK